MLSNNEMLNKIVLFTWRSFRKVKNYYRKKRLIKRSLRTELIEGSKFGEVIFTVKETTQEKIPLMRIENHVLGGEVTFFSPPIELKRYTDALIFPNSDCIILPEGVIWHKSNKPQFAKVIPLDKDIIDYSGNQLYVTNPLKTIDVKSGFSFCGVHTQIWSHFLIQYLPKIDVLSKLIEILDEELTVILPDYRDKQIKEVITVYLGKFNRINLLELHDGESVKCKNLYHVENTSYVTDHASYLSPSDFIIPHFVLAFLKNKFVENPLLFPASIKETSILNRKLFIKRNGQRNLVNINEIEDFFKKEGFEFVSPQDYSLEQKKKLFYEASFIAGPGSSGFTNVIFCRPGTKVLAFINFQRVYDLYFSTISNYFNIDYCMLTGYDSKPSSIHSSFYVSLEKIKEAYKKISAH